jgi:putative oxidoreductase
MKFLKTKDDAGMMIARVLLGVVFFPHGAQKLLGWFGGYGFSGTMDYFTGTMDLPWIISFLVIEIEFFGALALIAGLGTRLMAFAFTVLTLGIIFISHIQYGFFMNWFGAQKGEGIEYFLLVLGLSIPLMINGGGKYSIDKFLAGRKLQA